MSKFALVGAGTCGVAQLKQLYDAMAAMDSAPDVLFISIVTNAADSLAVRDPKVINLTIGDHGTGGDQGKGRTMWAASEQRILNAIKTAIPAKDFPNVVFVGLGSICGGSGSEVLPALNEAVVKLGGFMTNVVSMPENDSNKAMANTGNAFRNFLERSRNIGQPIPVSFAGGPGMPRTQANQQAFKEIMSVVTLIRELGKRTITGVDLRDVFNAFIEKAPGQSAGIRLIRFTTQPVNEALKGCATGIGITATANPLEMNVSGLISYKPAAMDKKNELLLLQGDADAQHVVLLGDDKTALATAKDFIAVVTETERMARMEQFTVQSDVDDILGLGNDSSPW